MVWIAKAYTDFGLDPKNSVMKMSILLFFKKSYNHDLIHHLKTMAYNFIAITDYSSCIKHVLWQLSFM